MFFPVTGTVAVRGDKYMRLTTADFNFAKAAQNQPS